MADPQHVEIVRQGANTISRWRENNSSTRLRLDLTNADLSNLDLSNVDLANDDLRGVDLKGTDLKNAILSGANLREAKLQGSNLERCNMSGVALQGSTLVSAALKGVLLTGGDLSGSDVSSVDLSVADMSGSNFTDCDLTLSNLRQSDLTGSTLINASLVGTNLDLANLSGSDLRCATILRTSMDGTLFTSVRLGMTVIGNCDLSKALDLNSARHSSASTIGLDTLIRSNGGISDKFLSDVGLPGIRESLNELNSDPKVISKRLIVVGSSKDTSFMTQLNTDLNSFGITSWYLPVGDESVLTKDIQMPSLRRLGNHDVKILVCSENAYQSPFTWSLFQEIIKSDSVTDAKMPSVVCISLDKAMASRQASGFDAVRALGLIDMSNWSSSESYGARLDELIRCITHGVRKLV